MSSSEQITIIQNFVHELREQVVGLSDQELKTQYIAGEWTIAQVIHHLFDAHTNAYQLCKRVLSEDNAGLSWGQQEIIAELPDGKSSNIESSLSGLDGLHMRWVDMFNHVDDWNKFGTSIKSGKEYTLARLLEMYANHCENHKQQIQTILDAMTSS
ncbi:MAG: DinB family protein [Chloroflexota bacterium]